MVSMCSALSQIKDDPFQVLQSGVIESICDELDYHWRSGPLDPAHTVALFVQQIAQGNVPCAEVCRISDREFSDSAYCQARERLPLELLQELSRRVACSVRNTAGAQESLRWRGHRVWVVDGSTFSMPDTAQLQEHFGQPSGQKSGCGFPMGHLLALFDRDSGLMEEPAISPLYTSDLRHTPLMHARMNTGDVMLGDDSFSSWGHFALVLRCGLNLTTPSHHKRIVSFKPHRPHTKDGKNAITGRPRSRWIRSLGKLDQLVEWFKPQACPRWMKREDYDALPESIIVREIRRTIRRKGFRTITVTVVTTLLDAELYPADEIVELRMSRWGVEINLRHLKTTMKMDVLHCKSVEGVKKEVAVFVLVYNLVRALMREAADRQGVPLSRISFADALHWLKHAGPEDELPKLVVNPHRPNRVEPRVIKRRPKPYDLMNRPREQLRKALCRRKKAA